MSGLNQQFTKLPRGKTLHEFESHILRSERSEQRRIAKYLHTLRMIFEQRSNVSLVKETYELVSRPKFLTKNFESRTDFISSTNNS